MSLKYSFLLFPLALLFGCGDEEAGSDFGLVGKWEVADGCLAELNGSVGSLNCNRLESFYDDWDGSTSTTREILSFSASFSEARITLDGSIRLIEVYESETYDDTVLISGSATRSAGRQVSGLFAPFGGDWNFSGSIVNGNDARSVAGAATIFGDTATVYPDGESPVNVVATGLGVDINGSFLPKR
jgi:hypothetical protein